MNKISMRSQHGTVTIECDDEHECLDDVFDYLIEPVLLAAGYHPDSIKKFFKETPSGFDFNK